jgi:hypothetical protein
MSSNCCASVSPVAYQGSLLGSQTPHPVTTTSCWHDFSVKTTRLRPTSIYRAAFSSHWPCEAASLSIWVRFQLIISIFPSSLFPQREVTSYLIVTSDTFFFRLGSLHVLLNKQSKIYWFSPTTLQMFVMWIRRRNYFGYLQTKPFSISLVHQRFVYLLYSKHIPQKCFVCFKFCYSVFKIHSTTRWVYYPSILVLSPQKVIQMGYSDTKDWLGLRYLRYPLDTYSMWMKD